MNDNKKIIIIGAFNEIIELVEELDYEIIGLVDNVKKDKYLDYDIILYDSDGSILEKKLYSNCKLVITSDSPYVRKKLHKMYNGFSFQNLISLHSKVSKSSKIGEGVVIQYGVNISSEAHIGDFVKLNTYSNIMHNANIGHYTTIAPNVVILGNVKIGECCYIGSNSTILPNIEICDNTIIGAGAVVVKNIKEPGVYVGIPAVKIK